MNSVPTSVEELKLEEWEDTPTEALSALQLGGDWINWAYELIPDMIDLSKLDIRMGFFAEKGTPRGLIWDLTAKLGENATEEFKLRAFQFAERCAKSDEPELYNPALIGFYCKVAWSKEKEGHNYECGPEKSRMSLDELAAYMSLDMIENDEQLFSLHYGKTGYQQLVAAKTGKRRH
ncbi:hypothetical protein J7443_04370 [Tropicibacter sp. R15_0]|uniref:hypothetical protein n=1 Tax=Tropicibacter sp. R15_0 TaxID=2821101 RepID=UPI001ADCAAC1|nr:hypothetical protein [Tropicibacter sp. R15_0]MBO9464457.1 hypothetical protein [Tropicibacter sp. R15_0]